MIDKIFGILKPSFLSTYITIILLFIGIVLKANLITPTNPLQVHSAEARAFQTPQMILLEYKRSFTVEAGFVGTVLRSVKCNTTKVYDLPDTTRKFTPGTFSTRRTIMLPYNIPVGTKCLMSTSVAWQPPMSFTRFIQSIDDVEFEVQVAGSHDLNWTPTNEEG